MELEVKIPESLRKKVEAKVRQEISDRVLEQDLNEEIHSWFRDMKDRLLYKALGLRKSTWGEIEPLPESTKEFQQAMKPFRDAIDAFLADYRIEFTEKEKKNLEKAYRQGFTEAILDEAWARGKEDAIAYASEMTTSIVEQTAAEILEKE